jgi:hypothetical protein
MEAGDSFVGKQATINLNQSSRTSPTSTVIESAARVSSPYAVAMVLMFYSNLRNATLTLFERFLSLWWSRACLGRTMAFLVQNGIAKEAGSYLQHRRVVRQRLQCDVQHTKRTPS